MRPWYEAACSQREYNNGMAFIHTSNRWRRQLGIPLAVALAVTFTVGCGDDDGGADAATSTTTTTTKP